MDDAVLELRSLNPPPRDTLQQRVYRELRQAIMAGRFPPGRSLTIRALATALQTSSMPVREALRQLVAERAIETLANRSFGTPIMTRRRFQDLVTVRCEIEGYAAARAAERVQPATIRTLAQIDERMSVSDRSRTQEDYIAQNREFHFTVYRAAGSDVLNPLIETLWLQAGPYIGFSFIEGAQENASLDHHKALIRALRARDGERASRMLRADIASAAKIIESRGNFTD